MASPYELVLGATLDDLHPRLRAYFGEILPGQVGRGAGTFDRVGTPRRWLWPALVLLGRAGIAFPAWQSRVAFTVENCPAVDTNGHVAVTALRTFSFARGERRMVDAITAEPGPVEPTSGGPEPRADQLVDHLGPNRRLSTRLRATVVAGELHLHGADVALRIGGRRVAIPPALSPRVDLVERFDDRAGRQHVSVVLTLPIVGRLYEYSGHFDYAVVDESRGVETRLDETRVVGRAPRTHQEEPHD